MSNIVVVGSANWDMTLSVPRAPAGGETIRARHLSYAPGGKGANQAVAAARLGATVHMVARVGDDDVGMSVLRNLADNGVDIRFTSIAPGTPQGLAMILLEESGENRIVIVEGSNGVLSPTDVEAADAAFTGAAVVLLQNEISMETSVAAARASRRACAKVVWNPAPAPDGVPDEMAVLVDLLLVNESEATALSGQPASSPVEVRRAAEALRGLGFGTVVVTLGAAGALWLDAAGVARVDATPTTVVDTTGAGDTFAGALGVALAEGRGSADALRFANAAAALSVTKPGAQGGMPRREELAIA